jgi:hypothetical protein
VLAINEEASVEEFLRHYWLSHRGDVKARKLYREIKDKVIDENIESLAFSLDLAETAPLHRDIVRARDDDPELRRLLEGIRALGAKALYPALLSRYAVADEEGKEKLRLLASSLTAMFVPASGTLDVAIAQFKVQGSQILAKAVIRGARDRVVSERCPPRRRQRPD